MELGVADADPGRGGVAGVAPVLAVVHLADPEELGIDRVPGANPAIGEDGVGLGVGAGLGRGGGDDVDQAEAEHLGRVDHGT